MNARWLASLTALPRRWRLLGLLAALLGGLATWALELAIAPTSIGVFPWLSLFLVPAWWLLFSTPRQMLRDLARIVFWWLVLCGVGWLSVGRTGLEPNWPKLPLYGLVQVGTLAPLLILRHAIGAWLIRRRGEHRGWRARLRRYGWGALLVLLWLPVIMLSVNLHRAQAMTAAPPGGQRVVFLGAGGTELVGLWYAQPRPRGAVLLVHGIGAEKVQFLGAVAALRAQGYSVLTYDQRNHGESGGLAVTLGAVEALDARVAWRVLLDRTRGQTIPRLLFGISLGGAAAQLAAPGCEDLSGLVLDSTFARAEQIAAQAVPWPWLGERTVWLARALAPLVVGRDALGVAPVEAAEQLDRSVPVLILHARGDPLIPFDQGLALMRAYGHRATLVALDGRHHANGHVYERERYDAALSELADGLAGNGAR